MEVSYRFDKLIKKVSSSFFSLSLMLDTKIEELIWMIVHDYIWYVFLEHTTINPDDHAFIACFMDLHNTFVI